MKIRKFFDKKEKREKYWTRFQLNNVPYRPVAYSRSELTEMIDEIRGIGQREKHNLPVPTFIPTVAELFDHHKDKIKKKHQRNIFVRVSGVILTLIPAGLKVTEFKKAHIQKYIDLRRTQVGVKTNQPILDETIDKELASISSSLRAAPDYYPELDDYQKPKFPKAARKGPKRKRHKVLPKEELDALLSELRRPRKGKQTEVSAVHRRRLADDLEFRYETGLRKMETELLKVRQYFPKDRALRNVIRFKTETVTEFYPLNRRAVQIIEERITLNGSEYIFTDDGAARPSDYRTLKNACAAVGIPYGRYAEDGFIPHDLRRSFATNFIAHTDIETAREFLGHSNITQTGAYLKTNEQRMREAVRRSEKVDRKRELVQLYKEVRRRKMSAKIFIEKLRNLVDF